MRLPPGNKPPACRCGRSEKGGNSSFEGCGAVTPLRGQSTGLSRDRRHSSIYYESTGTQTFFRDDRHPHPRPRIVFALHGPETLSDLLARSDTLRHRRAQLRFAHPLLAHRMHDCQVEAITNLEESLAEGHPRAFDRSIVVESQIRTLLQAIKEELFTDLFLGRTLVLNTVIFAKDYSEL
jgi:type I site-specific restriction endonuclease